MLCEEGTISISHLIKDKVFELSGPNNSIATKIDGDEDYENCMMGAATGTHTISMKLAKGSADEMSILCGVVRDGAPCNEDPGRESTVGWGMDSIYGGLWGNGKDDYDKAGEIEPGLKFWLDGKPHSPGYTSGVTGPMCWATSLFRKGSSVEIVPKPATVTIVEIVLIV